MSVGGWWVVGGGWVGVGWIGLGWGGVGFVSMAGCGRQCRARSAASHTFMLEFGGRLPGPAAEGLGLLQTPNFKHQTPAQPHPTPSSLTPPPHTHTQPLIRRVC